MSVEKKIIYLILKNVFPFKIFKAIPMITAIISQEKRYIIMYCSVIIYFYPRLGFMLLWGKPLFFYLKILKGKVFFFSQNLTNIIARRLNKVLLMGRLLLTKEKYTFGNFSGFPQS